MWRTHNSQTSRMFLLSNKQTNKTSEIYIADFWILAHNREFYLDVSELPARHSTTKQRTRCYTDTTPAPELPQNIINIPCNHTGRYVIVETNYILPREEGAILEICEIEILGRYSLIKKKPTSDELFQVSYCFVVILFSELKTILILFFLHLNSNILL